MIGNRSAVRTWRPQQFGNRNVKAIREALIEPLWSGVRVLAHVADGAVDLRDGEGDLVDAPLVGTALRVATQADSAVLDGYVTEDVGRSGVGVWSGPDPGAPSGGTMMRQLLLGGRSRRDDLVETIEAREAAAGTRQAVAAGDAGVAFVAVDLLLVDGQSLLDVPLLERKRLLESVLAESPLVRVGIHVRPPVGAWLATWRNLGFRMLAYKDPNGRYRPGEPNEGWATARIPKD